MFLDQIVLIDSDEQRRKALCAMIESAGVTVAAFASGAAFCSRPAKAALFLVADEKRALQSMTVLLSHHSEPSRIIAYRPDPAVHDVVEAMKLGAADYLAWPFSPSAIHQRLSALARRERRSMAECESGRGSPKERLRPSQPAVNEDAIRTLQRLARGIRKRFAASQSFAPRRIAH